jgi:hypothetical protein
MIITVCGGLAVSFITAAIFAGMTLMTLAERVRSIESDQHQALRHLSNFYSLRLEQAENEELSPEQERRFTQMRAFVDWFKSHED